MPGIVYKVFLLGTLLGCTLEDGHAADGELAAQVHRLALDTLFDGRERARQLVIWATDGGDGPTFELLHVERDAARPPQPIDRMGLDTRLPVRIVDEREVERLFRENPDGWAAFYATYPGAPGLVELLPVRVFDAGRRAETWVGRACGEHCRNAWRVIAERGNDGPWRVQALEGIRVPGA